MKIKIKNTCSLFLPSFTHVDNIFDTFCILSDFYKNKPCTHAQKIYVFFSLAKYKVVRIVCCYSTFDCACDNRQQWYKHINNNRVLGSDPRWPRTRQRSSWWIYCKNSFCSVLFCSTIMILHVTAVLKFAIFVWLICTFFYVNFIFIHLRVRLKYLVNCLKNNSTFKIPVLFQSKSD